MRAKFCFRIIVERTYSYLQIDSMIGNIQRLHLGLPVKAQDMVLPICSTDQLDTSCGCNPPNLAISHCSLGARETVKALHCGCWDLC